MYLCRKWPISSSGTQCILDEACYGDFADLADDQIASSIKQICLLEKQEFLATLIVSAHRWACF
jgi:hypothetical protein